MVWISLAVWLWIAACVAGCGLSLQSARVLRRRSPWTLAGWLATALYFATAALEAFRGKPVPYHVDLACLAFLTLAFAIAGLRDEPQAEPWWRPAAAGATGNERRVARDLRRAQDERDASR